jgi:hypothetical protein
MLLNVNFAIFSADLVKLINYADISNRKISIPIPSKEKTMFHFGTF